LLHLLAAESVQMLWGERRRWNRVNRYL